MNPNDKDDWIALQIWKELHDLLKSYGMLDYNKGAINEIVIYKKPYSKEFYKYFMKLLSGKMKIDKAINDLWMAYYIWGEETNEDEKENIEKRIIRCIRQCRKVS